MLNALSARVARSLRRAEPRQSVALSLLYPASGVGSLTAITGGRIRLGHLELGSELREQILKGVESLPDGVGLFFDRSIAEMHAFHLPQGIRDDLIKQIEGARVRRDQAKKLGDGVIEPVRDGRHGVDVGGGLLVGKHVVLLVVGDEPAGADRFGSMHTHPAATSRPVPSAPPPVDGIPSADVAPPASAETLSPVVPPKPVRFVTLKLWATRIGIVALVATGFGTFALAITWSVTGLAIGAAVGAALAVRRAMRLSADDIHF